MAIEDPTESIEALTHINEAIRLLFSGPRYLIRDWKRSRGKELLQVPLDPSELHPP